MKSNRSKTKYRITKEEIETLELSGAKQYLDKHKYKIFQALCEDEEMYFETDGQLSMLIFDYIMKEKDNSDFKKVFEYFIAENLNIMKMVLSMSIYIKTLLWHEAKRLQKINDDNTTKG